jgi:uncharacterized membrane protein
MRSSVGDHDQSNWRYLTRCCYILGMSFRSAERGDEDHGELLPQGAGLPGESSLGPAPVFEAVIVPHRSLTGRGTLVLIAVMAICSAAIAARFWLLGAWPVIAFSGVEVSLASLLLGINLRHARARELISLSSMEITVVQTDHRGRRRSFSLPSAWLQIRLETSGNRESRLLLRSHGRGREVAAFLHTPAKLSLFESLRDALYRLRQPCFDNEQLREG